MHTFKRTVAGTRRWAASLILIAVALNVAPVALVAPNDAVHAAAPSASRTDSKQLATMLVKRAGVNRGVCAILGRDGDVSVQLAKSSELFIHVRDPRAASVAELRTLADRAGFGIDRFAVEQGRFDRLPYADNMVDAVIASRAQDELLRRVSAAEVLRVLRPGGKAIVGLSASGNQGAESIKSLISWSKSSKVDDLSTWHDATGVWVQFSKPALDGAGDWSHWEHGPDNNPVSTDTVIKAPYLTQFLATPYYIPIPSITTAAAGRTFLATGHIAHHRREWKMFNKLIARNGYNGTVLWTRELPEGYLVHRSAFIATADTFYMIDGSRALLLDPETGAEIGEIRIPDVSGDWKWMAIKDGVLYALAGRKSPGTEITKGDRSYGGWSWGDLDRGYYRKPRIAWGFGHTLAAYHLKDKRLLWKHSEDKPIDSRSLSIGKDRITVYAPELHFRCLDLKSGKVLWTNNDKKTLELIEEQGKGLTSTPGFRTACQCVFTPDALIIQGQTRMNVVAISPADGYLLWTKKKVTNNPNAIYVDGKVIMGIGEGGSHVVVDPSTGEVLEDLKFKKRACTRLTACSDSYFVRGEGMLRYDRSLKKVLVDGSVRPACNDGAMTANGLLYLGPWQCDCNLSLIGNVARCSAGDFRFDHVALEADRLKTADGGLQVASFTVSENDWPTYRGNNNHSGSTKVRVAESIVRKWEHTPSRPHIPTVPIAAGGLIFSAGQDGKVRALESGSGKTRWEFATPAEIKAPPTAGDGKVFFGSADGHVYALEAKTGRLVWKFRAAPLERHIMVYGRMSSTWPVNSGVLVQNGTVYFAAGIIDYDGTYVYALDAETGTIKWQNNSSGHLNTELRKGVSAQGHLTIQGDRLLLAGGNQVSPAPFDIKTGKCLAGKIDQGGPKANHGRFAGVFDDDYAIVGGRILFSAAENVSSKGSFSIVGKGKGRKLTYGGIPPAWSSETMAFVNFKHGKITACDSGKVRAQVDKGYLKGTARPNRGHENLADALLADGAVRWQSDLGGRNKFEVVSLAVCPNAIIAVAKYQRKYRAQPQWYVAALDARTGNSIWRHELRGRPLPEGLLVDGEGQVVVTMLDGRSICLGHKK